MQLLQCGTLSLQLSKCVPVLTLTLDLPPWLSGLAISGRGAVKAWLAIRQGVGSYPTPAGMSSQVSA